VGKLLIFHFNSSSKRVVQQRDLTIFLGLPVAQYRRLPDPCAFSKQPAVAALTVYAQADHELFCIVTEMHFYNLMHSD
jgi:hypothetical protein